MNAIWNYIQNLPIAKIITSTLLLILCLISIQIILAFFNNFLKRSKLDPLVCKILRIIVKSFLLFTTVIFVLSNLGISVSSLIAALSVVGVAFSLAIQGFLSNVFGGIQIITNKAFKIGDYVEAGNEAGTVREVGLFYTKLDTPDKKLIQIPNSKITNESIINYSNAYYRRIEFLVSVSYENDVEQVKSVFLSLLSEHPLILKEGNYMPVVHVKEFRDSDICYTARAWCENKNYWTVYFDIMDKIKPTFEQNGVTFSYPHMNVHVKKEQ